MNERLRVYKSGFIPASGLYLLRNLYFWTLVWTETPRDEITVIIDGVPEEASHL